jgi:hypothetical protein
LVPYTVRSISLLVCSKLVRYNGAWNVVAAFIYERNAKHWAEVMMVAVNRTNPLC